LPIALVFFVYISLPVAIAYLVAVAIYRFCVELLLVSVETTERDPTSITTHDETSSTFHVWTRSKPFRSWELVLIALKLHILSGISHLRHHFTPRREIFVAIAAGDQWYFEW
jgi:hypothetical protein